jgi:hypothetical protein
VLPAVSADWVNARLAEATDHTKVTSVRLGELTWQLPLHDPSANKCSPAHREIHQTMKKTKRYSFDHKDILHLVLVFPFLLGATQFKLEVLTPAETLQRFRSG